MATSVDGDIRLSVGLDTSSIESQLKSLLGSLGKNTAKLVGASAKSFDAVEKSVADVNTQVNNTEKSIKSVTTETTKSTTSTKSLFGSLWKGYSDVVNRLFKLKDTTTEVTNETAKSEGRMTGFFSKVWQGYSNTVNRIFKLKTEEEQLGAVTEQTGEKMAKSFSKASAKEMSMELQIKKAEQRVEELRSKLDAIENAKVPTKQFEGLQTQATQAEKHLLNLLDRAEAKYTSQGKAVSEGLNKLIDDAYRNLERLEGGMERLKASGNAFRFGSDTDNANYSRINQQYENAVAQLEILKQRQTEAANTGKKAAQKTSYHWGNAFKKIRGLGSKMFGHVKNIFKRIKDKSKDSAGDMEKSFKRGFRNILKYALGIRSFYLLFRKIRSAAKEALTAMAKQFPEVNTQLSNLKNSFIQLKGSIGTIVQPLLQVLAPALTSIINMFAQAATAVGSFFALLTGQKYIYKAQKGTTSFAGAQEDSTKATKDNTKALKENQKQLGNYDKLNIIDQDKDKNGAGGGGAGAGADAGQMTFEKVPVDQSVKDFIDRFKDAWKKGDLTEIGEILGTKLKNALHKIPWNKIQTEAEKTGKRLGTLLAGFISVDGLAKAIGNTIGQALNTLMLGIKSFIKNVPWQKFGAFLADMLSGALLAKDKNGMTLIANIADTLVDIVNAAIDTFLGFVNKLEWKKIGREIANALKNAIKKIKVKEFAEACGKLINGIVDIIYEIVSDKRAWIDLGTKIAEGINKFFHTVNWSKLGKTLSDGIKGILDAIISALDGLDWSQIGNAIVNFLTSIDWFGIMVKVATIVVQAFWGCLKAAFSPSEGGTAFETFAKSLEKYLLVGLGGIFVINKFKPLLPKIGTFFSGLFGGGIKNAAPQVEENLIALTNDGVEVVGGQIGAKGTISKIGSKIAGALGKVALVGGVALAGLEIGKSIGNWITEAFDGSFGLTDEMVEEIRRAGDAGKEEAQKKLKGITDVISKVDGKVASALKSIKGFNDAIDNIGSGKKNGIKNAIKNFNALSKKSKLTATETQVLKNATKKLTKEYPGLNKYVDKNTGLLKISKTKMNELISAENRHKEAVKAQKKVEQLYNQQAPLKKAVEEAQKVYDNAMKKMNDYKGTWQQAQKDWQAGLISDADMKNINAQMNTYANAANSAAGSLNKAKDAQKKNNEALKRADTLMQNANVSAGKLAKADETLTDKMDDLNISADEQKGILKELHTKLDEGKLSWKNYKQITGKAYKSADALRTELGKLGKVDAKPKVKVTVDKKPWDKLKAEWEQYNKGRELHIKAVYELRSDIKDKTLRRLVANGSISDIVQYYRNKKATGGIFTGSGWHNVQGYASGGTPKSGQFFMARENGIPELVGTIKNHTAVMNNNQIVASVANGVYRAVASVVQAVMPYVRAQTHAILWLAQNGLQLPEIPKITLGNVIPNNSQFLNAMAGTTTTNVMNGIDYEQMAKAINEAQTNQPIIVQMPNGKVLAEVVWDEQEKKYKQQRSSTLTTRFA